MATSDLQVGIGVDLSELTNGLKKVSSQLESFSKNTSNDAKKVGDSWTNNLGGIVKGFISLELASRGLSAIKNVFLLEERFNALKMPLKNVTEATGDYGVALTFITKLADQTGQDLFVLGDSYKGLYASAKQAGIATTEIHNIFGAIVRSGSALKLSNEQVALSLKAVEQMMNKGTISSEELKGQLGEQLPGAYAMMAKAAKDAGLSVSGSTQELGKLLDEGKVASAEVLPFFAKRMEEAFGKNADANINTISGSANRLNNELAQLVSALDESKVTSFWASIQNGIADVMKDLTFMVKSGSFRDFLSYMNGQGFKTTGMRLAQESTDANFASKNPKEQAKIYRELNLELQENIKNSRDLIKAGITPNTEALSKLADQVKRYKGLMSGTGSGGGGKTPPLVSKGEIKAVQDYSFEMSLLAIEIKAGAERLKRFYESVKLADMRKLKFTPSALVSTMSRTGDIATNQATLGEELRKSFDLTPLNDVLEQSGKALAEKASQIGERITKGLKDGLKIKKNDLVFGEWILSLNEEFDGLWNGLQIKSFEKIRGFADFFANNFGFSMSESIEKMKEVIQIGSTLISDTFSMAFTSIFDKDVKFSFKNVLGNFLKSFGQFVTQIGQRLLAAGVLLALVPETAALGARRIAAGVGLLALGSAMGAAGGSMASNSAGSSMSSTTTNARSYSPYNQNGYGSMQTVEVRFANGALKGYIDNRDKKYNG